MNIKIKEGKGGTIISFGKGSGPIEKRSNDDLIELAIMAHESQDPTILDLFDDLPKLNALKQYKTDKTLKALTDDTAASGTAEDLAKGEQGVFAGANPAEKNKRTPSQNPTPSTLPEQS